MLLHAERLHGVGGKRTERAALYERCYNETPLGNYSGHVELALVKQAGLDNWQPLQKVSLVDDLHYYPAPNGNIAEVFVFLTLALAVSFLKVGLGFKV